MDHVVVDAVLDVARIVVDAEQPARVGFVFGEEQLWRAVARQPACSVVRLADLDNRDIASGTSQDRPG
jgi:hypothetical protein